MNTTEKEKFESLWTNFIVLVKGKLISTAAKQKLSTPLANLILSDAAASWNSDYEINGRWMSSLKGLDPQKAERVREVLLNDMHFDDVETKRELPAYYSYIIPVVGACAGYGVSMYLECSKIVQAASTIIPLALLFPAVNLLRNRMNESAKEQCVESYIAQLEKYKNSVVSILS